MKTNFFVINDRYVVKTGRVVPVDYVQTAPDDFDVLMADEVMDVCTGATFGLEPNYEIGKTGYFLSDIMTDDPYYEPYKMNNRPIKKRSRRKERINKFGGTHYNGFSGLKQYGENRTYRRRMAPNSHQVYEYEQEWLPF